MVALKPHELTAERRLRRDGAALSGVGARGPRLAFSRHLRERALRVDRLAPHRLQLALQFGLLCRAGVPEDRRVRLGGVALEPRLVRDSRLRVQLVGVEGFQRRERPREALQVKSIKAGVSDNKE